MTISTTQTRVSYNGNGVTDEFAFPYLFFGASDLEVYLVDALGASSLLTLNTDYTVTGVGDESGGEVTMVVPPASGERLVIVRVVSLTQETDYIEGDPFPAESHERGLDLLTMQTQQLQEALTRTLQLPVTSDADASAIDPSAVEVVAGIAADVTTVATNIADVTTVATNIADVTTVATNIANVNATATNIAAITDAPNQAAAAAQSAIDAQDAADAAAMSAASIALPLAIANGGTGQTTAANAFNALKQAATESATGVVELATDAEAIAGTDTQRAVTPAALAAAMAANPSGGVNGMQVFTSSGTFNAPAGFTKFRVKVLGAGGGGRGSSNNGSTGGTSSFGSYLSCTGGLGATSSNAGAGGTATGAQFALTGGSGTTEGNGGVAGGNGAAPSTSAISIGILGGWPGVGNAAAAALYGNGGGSATNGGGAGGYGEGVYELDPLEAVTVTVGVAPAAVSGASKGSDGIVIVEW